MAKRPRTRASVEAVSDVDHAVEAGVDTMKATLHERGRDLVRVVVILAATGDSPHETVAMLGDTPIEGGAEGVGRELLVELLYRSHVIAEALGIKLDITGIDGIPRTRDGRQRRPSIRERPPRRR